MKEYRNRTVVERAGAAAPPLHATNPLGQKQPPAFALLSEQYGLDDMQIGDSRSLEQQTIDQEFDAYINTTLLTHISTDIIKYWEVRNHLTTVIT